MMHYPFSKKDKIPSSTKEKTTWGIWISKTTSFFYYNYARGGNTGDRAKVSIRMTEVIWDDIIYNLILIFIFRYDSMILLIICLCTCTDILLEPFLTKIFDVFRYPLDSPET